MCTFGRLQTRKGGDEMMQGAVKGHLCHLEQLQEGPPAGFTVSNWGSHPFLASPQGLFCLLGTSGKRAENGRLESMRRKRG